jgi:hypothetical protein
VYRSPSPHLSEGLCVIPQAISATSGNIKHKLGQLVRRFRIEMNHHFSIAAMPTAINMTNFSQDAQCYLSSSMPVLRQYLTIEEEKQIIEQFRQS